MGEISLGKPTRRHISCATWAGCRVVPVPWPRFPVNFPAMPSAIALVTGATEGIGRATYVASKHAVLGFSRSLMLEVRKEGVRVMTICPGSVTTGLIRGQEMLPRHQGAILEPEDVAQAILDALGMPERALISEIDLRPANP